MKRPLSHLLILLITIVPMTLNNVYAQTSTGSVTDPPPVENATVEANTDSAPGAVDPEQDQLEQLNTDLLDHYAGENGYNFNDDFPLDYLATAFSMLQIFWSFIEMRMDVKLMAVKERTICPSLIYKGLTIGAALSLAISLGQVVYMVTTYVTEYGEIMEEYKYAQKNKNVEQTMFLDWIKRIEQLDFNLAVWDLISDGVDLISSTLTLAVSWIEMYNTQEHLINCVDTN